MKESWAVLLEFGPLVFSGLGVTIFLALLACLLSILFGVAGTTLKLSSYKSLRMVGDAYTTLIRGVPDLVLMLIVYYGGQTLLNQIGASLELWNYIEISPFAAGVGTIGFIFGAYMTETFRGAFLAVPVGQIEAAKAIGMKFSAYLRRIIWPQIVPLALPGFTNNWLVLLKTTALVSIIGLQDVMYNAHQAGRTSREPFLFLFLAFFIYLILTLSSDYGLKWLDRRYKTR